MTTAPTYRLPLYTGVVLLLLSLGLGWGGIELIRLGDSAFYGVAALGLALTGVLLCLRTPLALATFACLLALTLAWAVWEAGLDWWPLAARLDLLFLIGLFLLLPANTRGLRKRMPPPPPIPAAPPPMVRASWRHGSGLFLTLVLLACAVVSVVALAGDLHDMVGVFPAVPAQTLAAQADGSDPAAVPPGEWHAYGRTPYGQRFSPLQQITPDNVHRLHVVWQYRTGDLRGRAGDPVETTYEVTPLKVGNSLFLCTPHQIVIALDASTGGELWRFDPKIADQLTLQHMTCRGVAYQPPPPGQATPAASGCTDKLFLPTADGRLIALNPDNGKPCLSFGGGKGEIDLWQHMPNRRPGAYYSTSPPVLTQKLVVVGGSVIDNLSTHEQSGVIRAFDIDTGALVWNWDSAQPEQTAPIAPGQLYTANSPNSWSVASVDEGLGLIYLPMGNQPPDQWGGQRSPAVEQASSSVVALDLHSGRLRWVFQTVHHDLWDYDVPAQPSLLDLDIQGQRVPALVQATKQGELFVLDRRSGTPLLPVSEVAAPQGAVQGDHSASTQPHSAISFEPRALTPQDMWGATLFDQMACRIAFAQLRYEGRFTPPSLQGSLIYPGNFGVFNWGGIAVDPQHQLAFAAPAYLAFVSQLVPRPDDTSLVLHPGDVPKGPFSSINENFGAPYAVRMHPFLSPLGIPCQAPPWGYVAGVDLRSGKIAWMHRNGTVRDLSPLQLPFRMGVPSLGGPIITASGLAFLSGSMDNYVRAYRTSDGLQLWQSRLPAGAQATPSTYLGSDGRQLLVVVAGGHGSTHTRAGDYVIAYALD